MAIQIPNVGTGVPADQTGDSPWLAMQKVADNFSNPSHAASRLVGKATGNLLQVGAFGLGFPMPAVAGQTITESGVWKAGNGSLSPIGIQASHGISFNYSSVHQADLGITVISQELAYRCIVDGVVKPVVKVLTSLNTTIDGNGFIKAASPIVKVFADKAELNEDAAGQNVSYKKNGVGDYTITTVSGLSTDGWYLELPLDLNGNPKVAVTLTETDGIIELGCYKRTFNMTTFVFEPDLDEPLDIPDGRWIDIRLNEIEHEATTMPDVDLDKKD